MSLLVTHDQSLKDESLRTIFAETEAILNSRSLAIEILGNVESEQPICLNNSLTMKTKVVILPSSELAKVDEFSRC